ncbi:MAG: glycosyltransferase family 4 protein [Vicinamibacterales bacterium]
MTLLSRLDPRILVASLVGFYVLLPLDRGFPSIPVFGRPLNPAIAATLGVLFVLIVQSRGALLSWVRDPYVIVQSLYAVALLVGALRAPSAPVALHWSFLYYCTFVLNYLILRHVTGLHGTRWLSSVVVGFGFAAAGVSIVQSVFGIALPIYHGWYENYFSSLPEDYALPTSRAAGTMNNPILYCVLMALIIPFALDLQRRWLRAIALFTVSFAAALSGSRTGVFVVAAVAAAAVAVYRWRAVRALPAVALGLLLLGASLAALSSGPNSRLGFLVGRLGYLSDPGAVDLRSRSVLDSGTGRRTGAAKGAQGSPSRMAGIEAANRLGAEERAEVSAALGVSLRQEVVLEAVREMAREWGTVTWLVGRGSLTSSSVGMRIQLWYTSVDNVFLSVLYERGLTGLALFLCAFIAFFVSTWRAAPITVHWYAPAVLAVTGLSFCWDAYSTFNILAVGSMAVAAWHAEQRRYPPRIAARAMRATDPAAAEERFAVSTDSRPHVAILTNVLPSYRRGFYDRLFARQDLVVTVYCQPAIQGINVEPIHDRYPDRIKLVRSVGWKGEALAWQFTPWRELLTYDVVFVDGNPRILSHAVTATLLRLLRRNVVLWTMGHSYRANALTERIRLLWSRMFDRLFVYTDAEIRFLRTQGFASQHIVSMNNGLDQHEIDTAMAAWSEPRLDQWRRAQDLSDGPILLSCARLDPKNRFEQVIAALPAILQRAPDAVWCVIGGGADEHRLAASAREAGLSDQVRFVGELYDEEQLAPWFLSAAVFLHPGAIGLSLLHAFGYGLPVVTHGEAAHHGPEFAAFEEGRSGRSYPENDAQGLGAAVLALLYDQGGRSEIRRHVRHIARTQFNVDVMVERFVAVVRDALAAQSPAGSGK